MPPATPRTRLYPALAWFYHTEYRGEAIRVARCYNRSTRRRHYRHGGDLCRRTLQSVVIWRANCSIITLDLTGAAGAADPGAGWLVITPDPAPYASTFVVWYAANRVC